MVIRRRARIGIDRLVAAWIIIFETTWPCVRVGLDAGFDQARLVVRHLTRLKAVVALEIGQVAPYTVADPGVSSSGLGGPNYDANFLQCVEEIVDIVRERHWASDSLEQLFVEVEGTCVVQEIGESARRGGIGDCGEGKVLLPGSDWLAHGEGVVHDYGLEVLNSRVGRS